MLLHAVDFQEHFETIFIRNSKENNNFRGSKENASQFKKSNFFLQILQLKNVQPYEFNITLYPTVTYYNNLYETIKKRGHHACFLEKLTFL